MRNRWKPGLLSPAFGPTTSQSTHPESVHPALAAVAGTFNDLLADDHRRLLTPLAPWLLGTGAAGACAWPALADVCVRAAPAWISRLDQPGLPLALSWAGWANRGDADALCQLLVDCMHLATFALVPSGVARAPPALALGSVTPRT